jgi:hypothetical protein
VPDNAHSTLGGLLSLKDRVTFIGRRAELALVEGLLVDEPPASVVLVHGPGGIGKSALLREIGRRGRRVGWSVVTIEGRELPPLPGAFDDALAPAHEVERPLVLIDSYERMAALGPHLRRVALLALPRRAVVVVAGRRPPDHGWFAGGWELVTREVELGPLSRDESLRLLDASGLADHDRAAEVSAWAAGSPLALTLAARATEDPAWWGERGGEPRAVVRTLVERLVAADTSHHHRDVLWLACIARVTTVDLIADVLPDRDAVQAMRWLMRRTFAEPLGDGVTVHELVRRALRSDLRQRDPERERDLRRRVADSLHARAVAGRALLTIDLADLVESPDMRALYSWEGAVRTRIDSVREGDAEQVAGQLAAIGDAGSWAWTRRFFEEAPEIIAIARGHDGSLRGFSISVTPAGAPTVAERDPVLGPWLRHARATAPDGNAIVCRNATDFARDRDAGIQAVLNVTAVLRSGLPNPRHLYFPIDPGRADDVAFSAALGARRVPELDMPVPDRAAGGPDHEECHLLDCGLGGLLGLQRDIIYAELGLAPPGAAASAPSGRPPINRATVRDALRNLRVPHLAARSPLATGEGVDERAASVRRLLEGAAERAFGDIEDERLLHRVLVRGYLDPRTGHERAAHELNLSRSAYFRRLKQASNRVADHLAGSPGPWDAGGTRSRPDRH